MVRRGFGKKGFTLVEIMIVAGVLSILIFMAIPALVRMRSRVNVKVCVANLKRVSLAKEMWAVTNVDDLPQWADLVPDYIKARPECPIKGDYGINDMATNPTCSVAGHAIE